MRSAASLRGSTSSSRSTATSCCIATAATCASIVPCAAAALSAWYTILIALLSSPAFLLARSHAMAGSSARIVTCDGGGPNIVNARSSSTTARTSRFLTTSAVRSLATASAVRSGAAALRCRRPPRGGWRAPRTHGVPAPAAGGSTSRPTAPWPPRCNSPLMRRRVCRAPADVRAAVTSATQREIQRREKLESQRRTARRRVPTTALAAAGVVRAEKRASSERSAIFRTARPMRALSC
jgi:hypothetical protein